ncbi:LCP family protein [Bacillus sp. ISL-37]|uniref:LCP family protein n=1 Tax=Bacillus sp. ISL-37 TaxID=2819123 RepID=UPI001BEA5931|nr:LCP family protein [Bacillus sp. ISL-37]MBT2682774.1 LCP family protein [Bacillus sp. ISL-37]
MAVRRRKVRWPRVLVALMILGIFMVGLVTIFQYIEGTYKAINQPFKKAEADSFQGEKDTKEEVNVLLLGSDSRGEKRARTDTIMVAHYNPQSNNVKLISFMRDMYVSIPGHGKQKLNAAYSLGGTELLRQTIKTNFGLDIHHYAILDFKGFEKAVDILVPEGIEVDVPYEMTEGIGMTIEEGKQQLSGKELLGYVRFRQDRLSDFGRVQRQQEVISKLKDEAVSLNSVTKLPEMLDLLHTHIDTNIDSPTLLAIGKDVLTNQGGEMQTIRLPQDGSFENTYKDGIGEVLKVDFDQNKDLLEDFLESD